MSKKTKIILGASMMAAGTALSIHAVQEFDVFGNSSSDEWELGIGLGLLGTGSVLLILGALADKSEMTQGSNLLNEKKLETMFAVAPTRRGICGGVSFRW